MTRRMFGKIAVAAFTKVNSKVAGVTIGAQTYSFRDRDLDAALAAMKEIGLGEAELWDGHILPKNESDRPAWRKNPPLDQMRAIRRKFDDAGIDLYALTYGFNKNWGDQELEAGFAIAKAMGVKYITSTTQVSIAPRLAPLAEKNRIVVAFHNHSNMKPDEVARPEDFEHAMKASPKWIGINLDIGHFTAAGFDAVAFVQEHHDKIVTMHIKDRKRNQGANVPLGEGDTPIKQVLQILKTKHYPIPANIEYEYKGADTVAEVKKCFDYCKAALS